MGIIRCKRCGAEMIGLMPGQNVASLEGWQGKA